ncbi:MAG: GntR family transcriptional regulator [Planctomycetota bacterium]|nr:GntR family transcriptional regulator [Planctomycetota bacterium]
MPMRCGYAEIAQQIRDEIIAEQWQPGQSLPSQQKLKARFKVSGQTIQRALEVLMRDGFICSRSTVGTFVAEQPPHLFRYRLVMRPGATGVGASSLYGRALREAAHEISSPGTVALLPHVLPVADSLDENLRQEIESRSLAGVIFAVEAKAEWLHLLNKPPAIPHVSLLHEETAQMPIISQDWRAFIQKALTRLARCGRRRIAFLILPEMAERGGNIAQAVAAHGLESRPYWIQVQSFNAPEAVRRVVHLLLAANPQDRPDALVIGDDYLVEPACLGIYDSDLRVPSDLDVLTHANFPTHTPLLLPLIRLGFDAGQLLRSALAMLRRMRKGETVPPLTLLPPVFEEERSQQAAEPREAISTVTP